MKTIIEQPDQFKTGYRILMLTTRKKDGGKHHKADRHAHVYVVNGREEFDAKFQELFETMEEGQRIYSSIDERDIDTAIRIFKTRQLEADYFDPASKEAFYVDIKNRFISSLANPAARKGTLFMVDIDDFEKEFAPIMKEILNKGIKIVHRYKTKNGMHLILEPFNPKTVQFTVLKNNLLLLAY